MFREAHKEIQCRQWVVGNFPLCHYTRRITLWTAAGVNIIAKYCQYITWSPITSEKWFPSAICFPNWVYNTDCVRWESNPQPFSCFYFLHNLIYFLQRCQTSLNIQRDGLLMKVTRRYQIDETCDATPASLELVPWLDILYGYEWRPWVWCDGNKQ